MSSYTKTRNFLKYKYSLPVRTINSIIKRYNSTLEEHVVFPDINIIKGGEYDILLYKAFGRVGEYIQSDWDRFYKWFHTIKHEYGEHHTHRQYKDDNNYHSYITEALQYTNGCADDF